MANVLIPKKSTVAAKVPGTSDLALGEIAINHSDKKLYARHPVSGTVQEIGGGGSVTIDTTAADLLSFSTGTLSADDPGADRIFFWDDSAGRATHLEVGTGLEISGTTLSATATGSVTSVSATGPLTSSGGSTPTISTSIATNRLVGRSTAGTGAMEEITIGSGLSLSGGTLTNTIAVGQTNLWIPASFLIPRTTNGCGVDSREIGATNRQNFDELLFDSGTDEFAQMLVQMPSGYNNSTITARFQWTASSGSGSVVWGIQARAFSDDDALDTAFGTAQTVTDTLLAANDMHISDATSTVTIGGTPAANRPIQFQIYRDADAGGDTLAVDARLLGVEILFN